MYTPVITMPASCNEAMLTMVYINQKYGMEFFLKFNHGERKFIILKKVNIKRFFS